MSDGNEDATNQGGQTDAGTTKDGDAAAGIAKLDAMEKDVKDMQKSLAASNAKNDLLSEQINKGDLLNPELMKQLLAESSQEPEQEIDWDNISVRNATEHTIKAFSKQLADLEDRLTKEISKSSATAQSNQATADVKQFVAKYNLDVKGPVYAEVERLSRIKPGLGLDDLYQLATNPAKLERLSVLEKAEKERKDAAAIKASMAATGTAGGSNMVPNIEKYKGNKDGIQKMAEDLGL